MLQDPWPPGRTAERKRHDALRHVSTFASTPVFTGSASWPCHRSEARAPHKRTKKKPLLAHEAKKKKTFSISPLLQFIVEKISSLNFSLNFMISFVLF